ncbi:MAG TPA: type II CAAX endopeptidase family protein [Chryseosolibacter sp.]|nr:type II CAAX endopeptidase family protein [Chryseosolibacter sp.]
MKTIFLNSDSRVRICWRLISFIVITFVINIPFQLLTQSLMDEGLARGYCSGAFFLASVLIGLYIQSRFFEKSSFNHYGLSPTIGWLGEFAFGCLIAAVQLILFFSLMMVTGNIEVTNYFVTSADNFSFLAGFASEAFGQLVGSTAEEVFFRAFLFYLAFEALKPAIENLRNRALIACIIISPLFGLAHAFNEGATILTTINLTIDAMMLSAAFLVTGRLGMAIGIHFAWNLMQGAVLGLGNSGTLSKVSIIQTSMPDNLLTGGAFGPEGSILLVVLDIIALIMILSWKMYHKGELVHNEVLSGHESTEKNLAFVVK